MKADAPQLLWPHLARIIGGVWTLGKLDVVIHDDGLLIMWASKLFDKGSPRELLDWRLA